MKSAHARTRPTRVGDLRLRPLVLSMLCLGLTPALAQTLPTGFAAIDGGVSLPGGVPAGTMTIQQTTARAIAQWQTFSIGATNTVNVAQPSAASVLLNRVVGGELSTIAGKLNANGHVYLINPNGVLFSKGSSVNVGGLIASTLDLPNATFMAGGKQLVFTRDDTNTASVVVENGAVINANAGGPGALVALMGATVSNAGTINVAQGSIGLASGRTVTVDFDGDGLTRFTIPADSKATTALVENLSTGSLAADGGRVSMAAASTAAKAQVVNQSGVVRARSLNASNGQIVLSAGPDNLMLVAGTVDASATAGNGGSVVVNGGALNLAGGTIDVSGTGNGGTVEIVASGDLLVDGTLTARGGGSGAGGSVLTEGGHVVVSPATKVDASGGPTGANGTWTVRSGQDITVSDRQPFIPNSNSTLDVEVNAGSVVNAQAVGFSLGRGTDVVLESSAQSTPFSNSGYSAGMGVTFDIDSRVIKSEGRDATLTVNSARNIRMNSNSAILSSAGALNVNFNADSQTKVLPAVLPIDNDPGGVRGGAIVLEGATIQSNGGNIRFYGQNDPAGGRAVGSRGTEDDIENGITVTDSLLSTCASGQSACALPGEINLRGAGSTFGAGEGANGTSGVGVAIYSSEVRTGSGAVNLDGQGGLGAWGVRVRNAGEGGGSLIASNSGNVTLTGTTRGWTAGELPLVVQPVDAPFLTGGADGVQIDFSNISTGGSVAINGTGADLTALYQSNSYASDLLGFFGGSSARAEASHGVSMFNSDITAGAGQTVSISGKAGSGAMDVTLTPSEDIVTTFNAAPAYGVELTTTTSNRGRVRAEGGRIAIQGRAGSDVLLSYDFDIESEDGAMSLLSAASQTRAGGAIDVSGRNILVTNLFTEPTANFFDVGGVGSGGTISMSATGVIAIDQNAGMLADAVSPVGNGGTIRVVADNSLRSHGTYSARGGASGGNGGLVETSAAAVDLSGAKVDASAPAGVAGTWLVDPFDVTIASGGATNSLPSNPFVPVANSTVQDGDINDALNGGTNVRITTGDPLQGNSGQGTISFDAEVNINVTNSAPVTLRLDAARNIYARSSSTVIQSNSGALGVEFNAGLDGVQGAIVFNGQMLTNGGNVTMNAIGNSTDGCAICLNAATIDTRTGRTDAGAGGSVTLTVPSPGTTSTGQTTAAINVESTQITTSTGNVNMTGFAQTGSGVRVATIQAPAAIRTTTGNIAITGVGAFSSNSADLAGYGVSISGASLSTTGGSIAVRGLRQAGGTDPGAGVYIRNASSISTTGAGDIEVTGEALGNGPGVWLAGATSNSAGGPPTIPASTINAGRHVVLRASNPGTTDAIVLDGTVNAGQVLNLRPGGVDATSGAGVDRTANPITLLGAGATGFAISAQEMARLTAATVVVGSNTHAGNIDLLAPMASPVPLTLQNGGGGNINLQAPVSASTLGLISGGNITQAAGATITAGTLLAQSSGGNVILNDPGNAVSANTLGGGAAGRFEFVNSGPLSVGPVSVTTFDAAGNLPQLQAANSMAADTVLIRTLAGSLTLNAPLSSTSGADLVAATTFQNGGGGSLSGAPWRIWADTWVGESRGGLVGSGQLPNLYHCAYLGTCTVTVSPGDNHFIYAQQPPLTVTLNNATRNFGQANPAFTYTLSGLILGDTGAGVSGTSGSEANAQSPVGRYPIFGTFTSAEGYLVTVVPGELTVVNALDLLPKPAQFVDVLRDEPTTYVYDRNIGQAPICFATGPLEGNRAQQGNDTLAREWSRVRTRPNLTSCLDTDRTNGCASF